ncbi:hypothetical protein CoNPh35_CDS0007 [Staphylococcus phage S-CoN_Ph35]|nr:hypothetical protein CoNPh35_CDS0007 [Staphylococcus phage S-CoN_Ph35]
MIGDVIPTGSVFTFNVSDLKEFKGKLKKLNHKVNYLRLFLILMFKI